MQMVASNNVASSVWSNSVIGTTGVDAIAAAVGALDAPSTINATPEHSFATDRLYAPVTLSWTAPPGLPYEYQSKVYLLTPGGYTYIGGGGAGSATVSAYDWNVLATEASCTFKVQLFNISTGAISPASAAVPAIAGGVGKPSDAIAFPISDTQWRFQWTNNSTRATGLELFYGDPAGGPPIIQELSPSTTSVDIDCPRTMPAGVGPLGFSIRAYSADDSSDGTGSTTPTVATPSNLVAKVVAFDTIRLTWIDNSPLDAGTKFQIQRGIGPFASTFDTLKGDSADNTVAATSLGGGVYTFDDTGALAADADPSNPTKLQPGVNYSYRVVAVKSIPGQSASAYVTSSPSYSANATITPVNLTIDSNNDGYVNSTDDAVEDDANSLGQIISAGDFQNGFDRDVSPAFNRDDVSNVPFVPVKIHLPDWIDLNTAGIKFNYDVALPGDVSKSGTGLDETFSSGSGSLRLWKTDSMARSIGDFIASGTFLTAADLFAGAAPSRDITLWLEGVNARDNPVPHPITMTVTPNRGISTAITGIDAVKASEIDWQLVKINSDGSTTEVSSIDTSDPSPTITLTQYALTNLRASADSSAILGDIVVSGTVDDPLADITPGPSGEIDQLFLYINDKSNSAGTIELSVTKTEGTSLTKPFDYTGTFTKTFSGVTIAPGDNVIRLIGTDPISEVTGFAEFSTIISVTSSTGEQDAPVEDYAGCTFNQSGQGPVTASDGFDLSDFGFKLIGPNGYDPAGKSVQLDLESGRVDLLDGVNWFGLPPAANYQLAHPSSHWMGGTRYQDTDQEDVAFIEQLEFLGQVRARSIGFMKGFGDAGVSLWNNTKSLAIAGGRLEERIYTSISEGHGTQDFVAVSRKVGRSTYTAASAMLTYEYFAGESLGKILLGDKAELNKVSEDVRQIFRKTAEFWTALREKIESLPPEEQGRILGRVYGEVTLALAGGEACELTKSAVLSKLASLKSVEEIPFVAEVVEDLGTAEKAGSIIKKATLAEELAGAGKLVARTAEDVNAEILAINPTWKPPYLPGTTVEELTLAKPPTQKIVRVFQEGATPEGGWMTLRSEITIDGTENGALLSKEQIRLKLNLQKAPDMITDVQLPGDFKIRIGKCNDIISGGKRGALQIEARGQVLNEWCTNIGRL